MKRTNSEIHLFSHQRTVRYIHSLTELSWPGPGRGQQRDALILRLGYHDPGHRVNTQWDSFVLPLSYHDLGHREDRQWAIPLSYHDPGQRVDRKWDSFIFPLSYLTDRPTDRLTDRPTDWLPLRILFYVNIIQAKSCLQMVQGGRRKCGGRTNC